MVLVASTSTAALLRGKAHAAGTTPLHVWLHYDYLVGAPDGHSDAPDPAAIQLVVDAYAAHGIELQIDNLHNQIPWKPYINLAGCSGPDTLDLPDVKAQYFHPTANHNWDYALFGDQIRDVTDCGTSTETGEAWIGYPDFVIAPHALPYWLRGDKYAVGGIFMHELGHNLGLRHGGGDDDNWKPNYISVMNYRFIFGIPYAATPGSIAIAGRRLDYSDVALPTLDKAHLDETLGVQGGPTDTDITGWSAVDVPDQAGVLFPEGPTNGPLDWNQDGNATERDVKVDVNYRVPYSLSGPFDYGNLTGFDDWAYIRAVLLGQISPGPKILDTLGEADEPIITGISPASGPASGGTKVTITGTHLGKVAQVIFGATKATQFTVVGDTTITAITPDVTASYPDGVTIDVTVVSAAGFPSPSVSEDQFRYTSVLPAISSVSPTSGGAGTIITLTGHYFTGARCVGINPGCGDFPFIVINDSTILTLVTGYYFNGLTSPVGIGLSVCNTYGCGSGAGYTVLPNQPTTMPPPNPNPPPTISGISPTSGTWGTVVTITGTNLALPGVPPPVVSWPSFSSICAVIATVNQDGSLTSTIPPCSIGGVFYVTTAGGLATSTAVFTVIYPPPTITGFSPTSGPIGTAVTLTGTNLYDVPGGPTVFFTGCGAGATNGVGTVRTGDETGIAIVPTCAQTGPLTVVTAGGSGASSQTFTFIIQPPTITSISPTSGPDTGGTTILITGSGFKNAITGVSPGFTFVSMVDPVTHVAIPFASVTVLDDSTMSAVTPDVTTITSAAGGTFSVGTPVDVRVTTLRGTSALTPADQFTYLPTGTPAPTPTPSPTPAPLPSPTPTATPTSNPPPTISGIAPTSGPAGTLVTITGSNLALPGATTSVVFGSAACSVNATGNPDGSLSVTVPACAVTGPIIVSTAGGAATSTQTFTLT
jgi:hypothetical protein